MKIKIAHMYPELLNLYGDMGNIASLKKRAEWRNIHVEVKEYRIDEKVDFDDVDILFIGGGSDKEQLVVCNKLKEYKEDIAKYPQDIPVCIAKTQYSLSDNPKLIGRPENFEITVREVMYKAGAGFLVAVAGDIMLMPGLSRSPNAERIYFLSKFFSSIITS